MTVRGPRRCRKVRHLVMLFLVGLPLVGLPLVGCSNDTSLPIRADQYGERWPYRGFDGGVLHCYPKRNPLTGRRDLQEITISLGGTEYGITLHLTLFS